MHEASKLGIEVHLIAETKPVEPFPAGGKAKVSVHPHAETTRKHADKTAKEIGSDYDVVFASNPSSIVLADACARLHGRPSITQIEHVPLWELAFKNSPWRPEHKQVLDALCKQDVVITNTRQAETDLEYALEAYDCAPSELPSCEWVPRGINVEACDATNPATLSDADGNGWCFSEYPLEPNEGIQTAITALALIPATNRPRYIVAGNGTALMPLAQFALMSGVDVRFMGNIVEVHKFATLKGCGFGLHPNWNPHVAPLFPLECAYAGRPCISGSSMAELETYSRRGVQHVDSYDTGAIATAIRQHAVDAAAGEVVSEADRVWIRDNRSLESQAKGIVSVARKAIGGRGQG